MKITWIIIYCCSILPSLCFGQKSDTIAQDTTRFIPKTLSTNEFINYQLPSLEVLFENAKSNPRLKAIEAAIEAARCDLKLTKRDWLQYFSVHAGYTYGILGTYTDQESQYTPLTTVYSGATQSSWTVGGNVSIPINQLFKHRLNVKKQKRLIENVEYSQQIAFDEIKGEIIELYCTVQFQLKMLKLATETITLYDAEYQTVVLDYINNKNKTNRLLSDIKNSQKDAKTEYEKIINELNILFLKLELICNTNLRNR